MPRTALALDPGERRTGLAGTDEEGRMAFPLETLVHEGFPHLPRVLRPIVEERRPEVLVVGLPLRADGSVGPQGEKVLSLCNHLRKVYPDLEVCTVDESHTTDEAHERLREAGHKAAARRKRADSLAALAILERWLEESEREGSD